ncbi:uncharacterized protein [Amphiura filiformis]|uniref:uncharacterized protein n=1 Tax=Amphiura filiformis TaxID=82378 RepID=UPI003B222492
MQRFGSLMVIKGSACSSAWRSVGHLSACSSAPCLNGGQCLTTGVGFWCICANGFTGTRCQTAACSSAPCLNGGQCLTTGDGFWCICANGFTGTRCQIAACSSAPCLNGGQCLTTGDGFWCICANGFTGTRCQTGDVTAPIVINCPQNIQETTSSSTATTADVIFVVPTVADNSGEAFVVYTTGQGPLNVIPVAPDQHGRARLQATLPVGQTIVTVEATDVSGNTNNQCRFTITVTMVTEQVNPCASNPCPARQECFYTGPSQYICSAVGRKRRDNDGNCQGELVFLKALHNSFQYVDLLCAAASWPETSLDASQQEFNI